MTEMVYCYDGTFDGFLCCIFESYAKREVLTAINSDEDSEPTLYPTRRIVTDREHARRVYRKIRQLSPAAAEHRLDDVTDTLLAGEHARVFGPEIPALFFWMRESEVRNARLMATGLGSEAGRSAAAERMRGLYA